MTPYGPSWPPKVPIISDDSPLSTTYPIWTIQTTYIISFFHLIFE
jgi:hypothetical protein